MNRSNTLHVSPLGRSTLSSYMSSFVNRGTIGGIVLGSLAAVACRAIYRQIGPSSKGREKPVEVQRWEGEGGNLAPSPAKPLASATAHSPQ